MRVYARKEDTRRKIELGGLVIKAGLADEPAAVLLGGLLNLAKSLQSPDGERTKNELKKLGDSAFRIG